MRVQQVSRRSTLAEKDCGPAVEITRMRTVPVPRTYALTVMGSLTFVRFETLKKAPSFKALPLVTTRRDAIPKRARVRTRVSVAPAAVQPIVSWRRLGV